MTDQKFKKCSIKTEKYIFEITHKNPKYYYVPETVREYICIENEYGMARDALYEKIFTFLLCLPFPDLTAIREKYKNSKTR